MDCENVRTSEMFEAATRLDVQKRLEARKVVLDLIDVRRRIDGDAGIGREIEYQLLSRELADLERLADS